MPSVLRQCLLLLIVFGLFWDRPLDGQQPSEICLQPIRLDEGSSAILGTVFDDDKQPVAGAEIYGIAQSGPESKGGGAALTPSTLGTTETGDSGDFLIIVPFTGTQIRLRATHWGFDAVEQSITVGNRQIVRVQIVLHRRRSVTTQGEPNTALQTIYFATDRMPRSSAGPEKQFGTERSSQIRYGMATIALPAPTPPKAARFGVMVAFMDNPNLDTRLEKLRESPNFWNDVRAAMDGLKIR